MTLLLPSETNLVVNPSFETDANNWTTAVATNVTGSWARSQVWAWVGAWAESFAITGGTAGGSAANSTITQSARPAAVAGQAYTFSARTMTTDAGIVPFVRLEFFNSTGTVLQTTDELQMAPSVNALQVHQITAQAPTNTASVRATVVVQRATTSATGTAYVDGCDLKAGANPTSYVDGDQPGCHWNGTPHASTSYRDAVYAQGGTGTGGTITVSAALYQTDKNNIWDETGKLPAVLSGKVVTNVDAPVTQILDVDLLAPTALDAYVDCVAPVLTLTHADGTTVSGQVGLFVVIPPPKEHRPTYTTVHLEARDLTWLLQASATQDTYNVAAGTDPVAAVIQILANLGFLRWNLPLSGKTLPKAMSWPPATNWYQICTDLLNAIGWYAPWTTNVGEFTSRPYQDLSTAHPAKTFVTGDGGEVTGVVTEEPNPDDLANVVIVVGGDPTAAPIVAVATNADPASASSTVSLNGTRLVYKHEDSQIVDKATANVTAQAILQQKEGLYTKLTVDAVPDPTRGVNEVYALSLAQDDGTVVADGTWHCIGWTLYLDPGQGPMEYVLARVAPFRPVV